MPTTRPDGLFESDFKERLKGLDAGAEIATFDGMSVAHSHQGREMLLVTTPSRCEAMARRFQERGIKPEWEVFGPQHILQDVTTLIRKGYDKPPYFINMVLGADSAFQGAMSYSHDILASMIRLLPPDSVCCVSPFGPAQLLVTTQAILLGGHVRVGLEDNSYYSRGRLSTNEGLVARTVRIIHELNMEHASPAEARDMLGLRPLAT